MPSINSNMEYETILVPKSDYHIVETGSYGEFKEKLFKYKYNVFYPRMIIPITSDHVPNMVVMYDMIIFDEKYRGLIEICRKVVCDGDFYTDLVSDCTVSIICRKKDYLKFKIKEL